MSLEDIFIVNGTEKVVVLMEDLALNKFFYRKKIQMNLLAECSQREEFYKSLQEIRKIKDGSYTYTFGNFKNIAIFFVD